MKKMNNKGFLLVETIVVATFTVTVLVALFLQFKNLLVNYNDSYNYNTVQGVYDLGAYKKCIQITETKIKTSDSKPYQDVTTIGNATCNRIKTASHFKTIILTNSDLGTLKEYIKNNPDTDLSQDMRNMIKSLKNIDYQDRLIAEFEDGTFASIAYGVNNK